MAAASDLPIPDGVLVLIFDRIPLKERIVVVPLVCRQWRRAAAAPTLAWAEFEWEAARLEQWHALMRWLRPRMPAVRSLRLTINTVHDVRSRRRFANHLNVALRALSARLAAAVSLQALSLSFDVLPGGQACHGNPDNPALQPPLHAAALLPLPSRTVRRSHRPLPSLTDLTSLELCCDAGVVLGPELRLLPSLRHLSLGPGRDRYSASTGAIVAVAPQPAPAPLWVPPALSSLTLVSTPTVEFLAKCGPRLPGALSCLRELHISATQGFTTSEHVLLGAATGRALEALQPLAGQLEVVALPPHCVAPAALAHFTALQVLVAPCQPADEAQAFMDLWEGILFHLRRLHTFSICVHLGEQAYAAAGTNVPLPFPLPLAALPGSLRELRLATEPAVDVPLPAGEYLEGLTRLCLPPKTALRLTPLLPFMPQLAHLVVMSRYELSVKLNHPGGSSGDAGMDGAAAAAAALRVGTYVEEAAAAGSLAVALARHPCFRALRIPAAESVVCGAVQLALRLQRLGVEVEMAQGWGGRLEPRWEDYFNDEDN